MRGALLSVLAACALSACASAETRQVPDGDRLTADQQALWRDAAGALDEDEPHRALEKIGPLLSLEPWHVPSHALRQDAENALGRTAASAAFYRAEASKAPADATRALLVARTVPREAGAREAAYRAAVALDPASTWPRIALAYELSRRARDEAERATQRADAGFAAESAEAVRRSEDAAREAETLARGAVADRPGLAAAHAAVADVLLASVGRSSRARALDALRAAEKARELDPGSAASWERLGRARRAVADDVGAADAFRRAVDIAPHAAPAFAALGRVLLDLRRDAEARDALAIAAELKKDDVEITLNHGVSLYRTRDLAAAELEFDRASRLAPVDPRPHQALALTRAERGDRDGAARAMQRYLETGGPDQDAAKRFVAEMRGAGSAKP